MPRLLWIFLLTCLTLILVAPAGASRTDRMCYDFDARVSRLKERLAWFEKTLHDDMAGLQQDKAMIQGDPRLGLANTKLNTAIRLCDDAIGQLNMLKDRLPREIECGDRHRRVRTAMDSEVQALNDVEGKLSGINIITNQYRSLRMEAASIVNSVRGPRY